VVANDECKTSSDGEESAVQTRYRMEIDLDLRFLHEFLWKFGTFCGNHIGTSNKNNGRPPAGIVHCRNRNGYR
jgi:hypothetical protein